MKSGLVFLMLLISFGAYAQDLPTQKEQYNFLQWYIDHKQFTNVKPELFIIDWGMFFTGDEKKMARLKVTLKERDHFYPQVINNKKIKMLDTSLLKNISWQKPGQNTPPFVRLSLPIFSRNKQLLFIYFERNDSQNGSGYGMTGIEVYIKNKSGHWQLSKTQPFGTQQAIYNSAVRRVFEEQ